METNDFLDIEFRPAEQIARRILVLHAVVQRVLLDGWAGRRDQSDQDPDEDLFDLRASLMVSGADAELTASESAFLSSPEARTPVNEGYDFVWDIEALSAILAATGLIDALPPPPRLSDIRPISPLFDEQDIDIRSLISAMSLPSDETAAMIREVAELWFWRASIERDLRAATGPEREQLRSDIREVALEADDAGLIEVSPAGDFAVEQQAIGEWSDDELAEFELASGARLRALNWLCGFGVSWEDTPIDI
jgi:hypothetical protein